MSPSLLTFDPMRSIGLPYACSVKAEKFHLHMDEIKAADILIFPQYWQVNTLVYALKKRIFPSIASYHLGHNKIEMTRALQAVCPANMPFTFIGANTDLMREEVLDTFIFPFVAKDVKNSMGRGVFLIENENDFAEYTKHSDVLYVQEKLPIERDLRVVYVGDRVLLAYWRVAGEGAFHTNVALGGEIIFEDVPPGAIELVEKTARRLGINHAGFDVAVVDGHFYFFEFNVFFGTDGLHARKINYGKSVYDYVCSDGFEREEQRNKD